MLTLGPEVLLTKAIEGDKLLQPVGLPLRGAVLGLIAMTDR
jgi:hypothetical protein